MNKVKNFNFTITHKDINSKARVAFLQTPHGIIKTPNFIFCATKATLKSITTTQASVAGADIILSNTYHLMLQPGPSIIALHGGLHKFLNWQGPILTDSGGFQIFSLGHGNVAKEIKSNRKLTKKKPNVYINELGVWFKSHINGKNYLLTPERSINIQKKLGADLVMVLDECTPFHASQSYTAYSMELSHRWAIRSYKEFIKNQNSLQALYGIVQGGVYQELRKTSANFICEQPFFGQAIGGSLGGSKNEMQNVVTMTCKFLDPNRPTHLLGIGGVEDFWHGVQEGIDTFDCTHPTRLARHGGALVSRTIGEGKDHLNIKNQRFSKDINPIETKCSCYTCNYYTRSYIHHLFKAKEFLAGQLITIHNISFMMRLAKYIRKSIEDGLFLAKKKEYLSQ